MSEAVLVHPESAGQRFRRRYLLASLGGALILAWLALALLAPLAWAGAVIFFKRASTLPALGINLFKNVLAVGLLGATMLALGTHLPTDRPLVDWVRLGVSGLLGLALAWELNGVALRVGVPLFTVALVVLWGLSQRAGRRTT